MAQIKVDDLIIYYNVKGGFTAGYWNNLAPDYTNAHKGQLLGDVSLHSFDESLMIPRTDGRVKIDSIDLSSIDNGNATVEFIAKFNHQSSMNKRAILKGDKVDIGLETNALYLTFYDGSSNNTHKLDFESYTNAFTNEYKHFALIVDGTNIKFLVDGEVVIDSEIPSIEGKYLFKQASTIFLGSNTTSNSFGGNVKIFRYYNEALTNQEVSENMTVWNELWGVEEEELPPEQEEPIDTPPIGISDPPNDTPSPPSNNNPGSEGSEMSEIRTDDLILYYNTKEGLEDEGWFNLAPLYNTTYVAEPSGEMSYDMTEEALVIAKPASKLTVGLLDTSEVDTGDVTIEFIAKFNPEVSTADRMILDNFELKSSSMRFVLTNGASDLPVNVTIPNFDPFNNVYQHFAVTFKKSNRTFYIYINGELVRIFSPSFYGDLFLLKALPSFVIGGDGSEKGFVGRLKVFRYYNAALTANEIRENYKVGNELWEKLPPYAHSSYIKTKFNIHKTLKTDFNIR